MNAPHPLQHTLSQGAPVMHAPPSEDDSDGINLREYWDIVLDSRWLIAAVATLATTIGIGYALVTPPVYQSNLLIQVEDSGGSAKSLLGEAGALFDTKTPAAAELEIIRSRMVIGQAVENTLRHVDARPRLLPVVGDWLSRRATGLSEPRWGGYVHGTERIKVSNFVVPSVMEGSTFTLTALPDGKYSLTHPALEQGLTGTVGTPLTHTSPDGSIQLLVTSLQSRPGGQFELRRSALLAVTQDLQSSLRLAEKGRQSGVIEATLAGPDRQQVTTVLNEIGQQYVRQNIERKAAEAQKTLAFLEQQLPQFKQQLNRSEEAYTQYRNQRGTVALDEEARLILSRGVEMQTKLLEAQQKRRELMERFTPEHPGVKILDAQIASWSRELGSVNTRALSLPNVQQDAVRFERDIKVNNELYQQLRNNALQLQLIREGKIGNVRVIDSAVLPLYSVEPNRSRIVTMSIMLGLVAGIGLALARNAFFRGIRSAQEIESHTGLSVYSTIPLSEFQGGLQEQASSKAPGVHLLAQLAPQDPAVESLRSLRTALQFAMLDAPNNRILITGATPGVGKSFVSANFAAVLASAGKRVLLIDADLRKGYVNQFLGMSRERGLSELISGALAPQDVIRREVLPNLDFIPTGALPPNPAELMISGKFANLLETLSAGYDLVIIDTAPVLAAADSLSAAVHAGTLLLVARAGETQLGELHESARRLAHAGKNVTGVLFNGVDLTRKHYGSYGYKYGAYQYKYYAYDKTHA
jgi:tyrosine-protein kinase Etk/Wzc